MGPRPINNVDADDPAAVFLQQREGGAWRRGGGMGLRCHWHSTIVRADYGVSGGRRAIYVTFAQLF